MRARAFVPDQNTPGKKDATGAFHPEALAFLRHHQQSPTAMIRFAARADFAVRRTTCTRALEAVNGLDVLALFCHGWRDGLQAGFRLANVRPLAALLSKRMAPEAHVVLYACDAGRDADDEERDDVLGGPGGDGGFADALRDACETLGAHITVTAHATAGHCTRNPYTRFFAPGCMGRGGSWYVEPNSSLWRPWVRALQDPTSTLRYRFWQMTPEQIAAELLTGGGPLVA